MIHFNNNPQSSESGLSPESTQTKVSHELIGKTDQPCPQVSFWEGGWRMEYLWA